MINIIRRSQTKPSIGERFSKAVGQGLEAYDEYEKKEESKASMAKENAYAKKLGLDLEGITNPKIREKAFEEAHKRDLQREKYGFESELSESKYQRQGEEQAAKLKGEKSQKMAPFESGLQTVNEMRNLRKSGNLGIGASYSPFGSTRKDAAQYEQLGKSLISLASNIPIRNQQEFKTLAENLYDPNITDASAEGILDAMENIIKRSMQNYANSEQEQQDFGENPRKQKRSINSFLR